MQKHRSDTPRIAYPEAAGCFPAVALSGDPTPKGKVMLKYIVSAQNKLVNLFADESGNAAEYGLIIGLVAVGIIVALGVLAGALSGVFGHVSTSLTGTL